MPKARVYELAKEFGVDSKTVLSKLEAMGEFVKSASSTVEPPVARKLRSAFSNNASGNASESKKPAAPVKKPASEAKPAAPKPVPAARQTPRAEAPKPGSPSAPKPGQRSAHAGRPGDQRQHGNRQQGGNAPRPQSSAGMRGGKSAPVPGPHAPRSNNQQQGGGNNAKPHTPGPRPGNNPFSRKQGMHTPTPGDIPRPHPMARPNANGNEGRRGGRPGQGGGQRGGFRGRPGQGTGAKPGQWGQHRPGQGGGQRPAGGGNRFGGSGNTGGYQGNSAPSSSPARGGGRGRGGAAGAFGRQGGKSSKARKNRLAKRQAFQEMKAPVIGGVRIPTGNGQTVRLRQGSSLADLAEKINVNPAALVTVLFHLGEMATATQSLDESTFQILGEEIGWDIKIVSAEEEDKELLQQFDIDLDEEELQEDEDLRPRPPVVTVMGHVDHGKTRLLDTIRSTNVIAREAGGITQRIGAYQVTVDLEGEPRKITFLDTPGHEAFTAMRARGAQVTDIAVLVVAADDGVMPQTVESINHAKSAGVPIIVAINKIDKESANPEHVMQQLTEYGLVSEDWGGDTIMVPVSAHKKIGLDDLLENILVLAEVQDLKANPNRPAQGVVIEAKLDKGRGPVASVLIQKGTLRVGDTIIVGTCFGKVRAMNNERGERVKKAEPSIPVEILGLNDVPEAGDILNVTDEKTARSVAEKRLEKKRSSELHVNAKVTLDDLFNQIQQGELKELPLIIKGDVQGSVEALSQSLMGIKSDEVRISIVHAGVGAINESDIMLASASNALIIGFNVRPDAAARKMAEHEKVDMRMYRVIYDAINDVEAAIKGMLEKKYEEKIVGRAEVRKVITTPKVIVGGSYVKEGKITSTSKIRLIRNGIVVHEGEIDGLRRFKDDVKEVPAGYECGITLEKYRDIKEGDEIEAYEMVEVEPE